MKRTIAALLLALGLMCVFAGCGDKDGEAEDPETGVETDAEGEEGAEGEDAEPTPTPTPEPYLLGEESVPAPSFLRAEQAADNSLPRVYEYLDLLDPGADVKKYVARATSAENGYKIVDSNFFTASAPDYEADEGEVRVAKPSEEGGKLLTVTLEWTADSCVVTLDAVEGVSISTPPETMSVAEAEDYIKAMNPAVFGLDGTCMEDYVLYIENGGVVVDNIPCVKLNVYERTQENTNRFCGSYFMATNGTHLYEYNSVDNIVIELPLNVK